MKTLHKLFNYITLFSYMLFLPFILITIVNIGIKFAPENITTWRVFLYHFSAIVVAGVIYDKTHKYLIQ